MFKSLKLLVNKENREIREIRGRIYYTVFALFIFLLGINVAIPGIGTPTAGLDFLELINVMGGGALRNYSIFALGVMPYISASIITELLQMDIVPYFSELRKQGPVGRQKINQINRYLGIAFAFIQGIMYAFLILGKGKPASDYLYVATILTAGTAFLLWLGDRMTQKGLGNGISLLIMAGIVASLPSMFKQAFSKLVTSQTFGKEGILLFSIFVIIYLAIVIGVVFVETAERRVRVQYANKTTSSQGAKSFMPIKINSAGVMPVIFASSLMTLPPIIAQAIGKESVKNFVDNYLTYTKSWGFLIFIILIILFSYFYTYIQFKPEEFAKNLNENGGFIPGVRPGKPTENYMANLLMSLTFGGAIFIAVIAALPIIFNNLSKLPANITIGGTGLLIVVGVALETYKQLEGSLVSRNYSRGYSRRK